MPKKKLNIVLVAALLLIWGLVMYKLFWKEADSSAIEEADFMMATENLESAVPDTIILDLSYRDPFLGKAPRKAKKHVSRSTPQTTSVRKDKKKIVKHINQPEAVKWPSITYSGMIENSNDSRKVAIVNIDNQSHLLAPGDTANQIMLASMNRDSIRVNWNGKTKTVVLN